MARMGFPYLILPLISACTWIGMLLTMLIVWLVQGSPHYASMDPGQSIAYISDIGAQGLKPLFIAGSCITTIFLDLSFAAERWLRHTGRLERNTTKAEKILSAFAIFFGIAGTAGLILLSIFDTLRHPHLHDGFLLLFIAGYILAAIFLCAEYQRLGIHFRNRRILRISFWAKLTFILLEVCLAIAFAVCTFDHQTQVGAVLEWIIALIFTFWVLSFLIDLFPASVHRHSKYSANPDQVEMGTETRTGAALNGNGHAVNGNTTYGTKPVHGTNNGSANGGATYTTDTGGPYGAPNVVEHANGHANGFAGPRPVTPSQNF